MHKGTVISFEKGIGVLSYGEMEIPFKSEIEYKAGDVVYFNFKKSNKGGFKGIEILSIKDSLVNYLDPFSDIRTLPKPYYLQKVLIQ